MTTNTATTLTPLQSQGSLCDRVGCTSPAVRSLVRDGMDPSSSERVVVNLCVNHQIVSLDDVLYGTDAEEYARMNELRSEINEALGESLYQRVALVNA